jgi:hypothetical protein
MPTRSAAKIITRDPAWLGPAVHPVRKRIFRSVVKSSAGFILDGHVSAFFPDAIYVFVELTHFV